MEKGERRREYLACLRLNLTENLTQDSQAKAPQLLHRKFTYLGKRITLFGVQNETSKCEAISARKLKGLIRRGVVSHCLEMKLLPLSANSQQQDMTV